MSSLGQSASQLLNNKEVHNKLQTLPQSGRLSKLLPDPFANTAFLSEDKYD